MPLGWFLFRGSVGVWFALQGVGVLGLLDLFFFFGGCLIGGWGLVIWPNVGLLVVTYLLHTCILFLCTYMDTTTGHPTWGVVFWFSLFVTAVPNLGCVGYVVKVCTMLRLHQLVVNCLLGCGHLVVLVGLWHNFCIFWAGLCGLKRVRDRRKDTLILWGNSRSCSNLFEKLPYSRLSELVFNLDDFCRALACWFAWLILSEIKDLLFSCFTCCFNNFVSKSNLSWAPFFLNGLLAI